MPEILNSSLEISISKISQILGSLRALKLIVEFFVNECLFGLPQGFTKIHDSNYVSTPTFKKKLLEPGLNHKRLIFFYKK